MAKYPGKRGLCKGVRGNLEFALIADGVSPRDVYKMLATSDGVDRAFRKLDQLKPYIVWWQTGAEAAHILSSGDVLMTTRRPAGSPWRTGRTIAISASSGTPGCTRWQSWAIVKGSPNLRQAQQFLYFAGMPAVEARLFESAGIGGPGEGRERRADARSAGAVADHCGQSGRGGAGRYRVSGTTTWRSCSSGSIPGLRRTEQGTAGWTGRSRRGGAVAAWFVRRRAVEPGRPGAGLP